MTGITRVAIGDLHTVVDIENVAAPAVRFKLGIGLAQLGNGPFRHDPPSELELESAIAVVEDAVMPLAKKLPSSTRLVNSDVIGFRLLAVVQPLAAKDAGSITLEEVEHLSNELVAVSLGRPSSSSTVPTDGAFFSYVLVLREFMHHLGFTQVSIEQGRSLPSGPQEASPSEDHRGRV